MGGPLLRVNPEYQVGQLGCPNPSANPIEVLEALGIIEWILPTVFLCL